MWAACFPNDADPQTLEWFVSLPMFFWLLWLDHRPDRSTEVTFKLWVEWELHSIWCSLPLILFNLVHSTRGTVLEVLTRVCGSLKHESMPTAGTTDTSQLWGCQSAPLHANALLLTLMIMAVQKMSIPESSVWSRSQLPCFVQERTTARCGLPRATWQVNLYQRQN